MFNISDIFDKYKKADPAKGGEAKDEELNLSSVVSRKFEEQDEGAAFKLYEQTYEAVKGIYESALKNDFRFDSEIERLTAEAANLLMRDDVGLLKMCFSDYPRLEDYLYYHVVNVCIISMKLSTGLGFEQQKIAQLGLYALLHDIGLINNLDIINQPRVLTKEEYARIREHPRAGFEILKKAGPKVSPDASRVAYHEHERIDGSGYPSGLRENSIDMSSQIVGVADVFEALTHKRPYRPRFTSLEASKMITDAKKAFQNKILKALFEKVGIFPVGAPVRLNTNELGIVLRVNAGFPLRPTVKVLFDIDGNELKEAKTVDLTDNRVLFVEECL